MSGWCRKQGGSGEEWIFLQRIGSRARERSEVASSQSLISSSLHVMMAEEFIYMGEPNPVVPPGATRVIVDKSVNIIPERAFQGNGSIVELFCHDGVEKVETRAFNRCSSLRRVIMPGVEVVEGHAFSRCVALRYVECGKLERIEGGAFFSCKSLTSIDLPSVDFVGESAFARCEALTDAIFGDKLETVKSGAFYKCTSLEQITIPLKHGMFDHGNIFQGCFNLKRVDLVGGLHGTVAALLMEEWRIDVNETIDSINQILSTYNYEKAVAIRRWIRSVLHKIVHYKTQHHLFLSEAARTLELASLPTDIVMKSVLPFLELPSYTFDGED
eukprot:scaffold1316_cov72-Skeletonema_dohrnii-CCMP3373.AAC.3